MPRGTSTAKSPASRVWRLRNPAGLIPGDYRRTRPLYNALTRQTSFYAPRAGTGPFLALTCTLSREGDPLMSGRLLAALLLTTTFAGPRALAGETKRCPYPMKECLDKMSSSLKTTGWVGIEFDDSCVVHGGYKVEKV